MKLIKHNHTVETLLKNGDGHFKSFALSYYYNSNRCPLIDWLYHIS